LKPYFFDRCLGVRLVGALAGYRPDVPVEHQDRCAALPCDISDVDLLRFLSSRDPPPIFVTADRNMNLRAGPERVGMATSGLTVVFVKKGFNAQKFPVQVSQMIAAWDHIVEQTQRCRQPTAFDLGPGGKIRILGLTCNL
jgi:hypothetical protein